jgi:hypothetical protein
VPSADDASDLHRGQRQARLSAASMLENVIIADAKVTVPARPRPQLAERIERGDTVCTAERLHSTPVQTGVASPARYSATRATLRVQFAASEIEDLLTCSLTSSASPRHRCSC